MKNPLRVMFLVVLKERKREESFNNNTDHLKAPEGMILNTNYLSCNADILIDVFLPEPSLLQTVRKAQTITQIINTLW